QEYIQKIEAIEGEIATSKATHMNFSRKKRDEIKQVFDEAKENGIPRKVLKNTLKRRSLEGEIDQLEDELDEDHVPLYQSLAVVFAAYGPMTQTSLFDEALGGEAFEREFVDPAKEQQEREQEEGEAILEHGI